MFLIVSKSPIVNGDDALVGGIFLYIGSAEISG